MEEFEDFKVKTKDYFYRNQKKIKIVAKIGIHIILIGGAVFLYKKNTKEIYDLKKGLKNCKVELLKSKELNQHKDDYIGTLASELLRKGVSEGGKILASRRKPLKKIIY